MGHNPNAPSSDQICAAWNAIGASVTHTQLFSLGASYVVKFSPDESKLVVVRTKQLALLDASTGAILQAVVFRDGADADFSSDGRWIAALDTSGGCTVFTAPELEALHSFPGIGEGPGPVFGPTGDLFVQGSWNGDLLVRATESGEVVLHEREPGRMISHLACSPDGKLFAYVSSTEREDIVRLRRWPFDENPPEDAMVLSGAGASVEALALSLNGHLAIRQIEELSVWDIESNERIAQRDEQISGTDEALCWSPENQLAATETDAPEQDKVTGLTPSLQEQWNVDVPYACAIDYSPSGSLIAIGSWEDGMVLRTSDQVATA